MLPLRGKGDVSPINGLNLDKGSTFSIVIDSLNPEDNEIDPKYGCE